jgi:hypothetical protein
MDNNFPEFPKVLSRDTDVKTLFFKDSGYSNMYQRSTNQIPMTSRRSVTLRTCEVEVRIRCLHKSLATTNTVSSVNLTTAEGDVVKLAEMIIKDELICSLIFFLNVIVRELERAHLQTMCRSSGG